MKKFLIITSLLLSAIVLQGQTKAANISFDNKVHNFGKIKEDGGTVTHKFAFINTGASPLIIQNVRATCGCTAPDWTKQPVPPGGKGYVAATFNPKGRPNAFTKSLYVTSNAASSSVRLIIKGEVLPKPRGIKEVYRYEMGGLRLKANHLAFGNITNKSVENYSLEVINNSPSEMQVGFKYVPAHISIGLKKANENESKFRERLLSMKNTSSGNRSGQAISDNLKPGEKGQIVAIYDAAIKNDWGMLIDRVNLTIDGKSERNFRLIVSANIMEDFSSMTPEQLANAPKAVVDNSEVNFGSMKQSEKFEHAFVLSNEGESPLLIRKIKASCGCTAVQPEKKRIEPGESVKIESIFNAAGKRGNQNKTITIITNDPDRSNLILRIKGEVIVE